MRTGNSNEVVVGKVTTWRQGSAKALSALSAAVVVRGLVREAFLASKVALAIGAVGALDIGCVVLSTVSVGDFRHGCNVSLRGVKERGGQ